MVFVVSEPAVAIMNEPLSTVVKLIGFAKTSEVDIAALLVSTHDNS